MQELSEILRQGLRKIFDKLLLHDRLMMTVGSWSSAREGLKQKQKTRRPNLPLKQQQSPRYLGS